MQYRIREFADLAGVTVRTLHHYDRLGLLKPKRRAGGGYRLYVARDLERLEQIVALKCLGLPLLEIRRLLETNAQGLLQTLRLQRGMLEEKRRMLETAIASIRAAELEIEVGGSTEVEILKRIIREMQMQNNTDWMMKYYSDEAASKVRERGRSWTPELQAKAEQDWATLFRDIEAALGEDPASAKAQALVDRWSALIGAFTDGDPGIASGLTALYADRQNWPSDLHQKLGAFSNGAVWEFINRARSARKES